MQHKRRTKMNDTPNISRRVFLKTAAAAAAIAALPPIAKKTYARNPAPNDNVCPMLSQKRTLGKGTAAMEVSALGFGVMGMTYNRSRHPDKKQCIRLLHQAVDHGVSSQIIACFSQKKDAARRKIHKPRKTV